MPLNPQSHTCMPLNPQSNTRLPLNPRLTHRLNPAQEGEEAIGEDGCGEVPLAFTWEVFGVREGGALEPLDVGDVTVGEWGAVWVWFLFFCGLFC